MAAKHSYTFGSGLAPIFQHIHGWHGFQAGIFFHIKITKLKGGWGLFLKSGSESLKAFPVGTEEQSYSSKMLMWFCCFYTVPVLFEGLRKSL